MNPDPVQTFKAWWTPPGWFIVGGTLWIIASGVWDHYQPSFTCPISYVASYEAPK